MAYLPEIKVKGLAHPVIQVINAKTKELIYSLRCREDFYRPPIYDSTATYNVKVGEPDNDEWKTLEKLKPDAKGKKTTISVGFR